METPSSKGVPMASKGSGKIAIKPSKVGSLRKAMGAKKGKKLSTSALAAKKAAAQKSGNTAMVKKTTFAINARNWKH